MRSQAIADRFADEQLAGWPEDGWVDDREKVKAVTATDPKQVDASPPSRGV